MDIVSLLDIVEVKKSQAVYSPIRPETPSTEVVLKTPPFVSEMVNIKLVKEPKAPETSIFIQAPSTKPKNPATCLNSTASTT